MMSQGSCFHALSCVAGRGFQDMLVKVVFVTTSCRPGFPESVTALGAAVQGASAPDHERGTKGNVTEGEAGTFFCPFVSCLLYCEMWAGSASGGLQLSFK